MKKILALLYLILLSCSSSIDAKDNFKILSYNVLKGLQQDSVIQSTYNNWVKKINPDIVAYQEMNEFTQKSLEVFARKYFHPYAVQSKLEGFPVALSSKKPIVNVQKVVDNMWHAYIYAFVNDIHVFVIHFSPFSFEKRREEVQIVLAHAALLPPNEKIVIMGDFNSLSSNDKEAYGPEFIESRKATEVVNAHIRNLDNGKIDYSITDFMKKAGFKDAYYLFNKNFTHSCPTQKYQKSKFVQRIDFMWLSPELAKYAVKAEYIYDEDTKVMSDHYPLLVEFDFDNKK